jgi:hypothetical protein
VGKFAKQIELAFSYDVDWVGDREVITDVFILDLIFCNMVHVDSDDSANGGVVEGRYLSAEFHIAKVSKIQRHRVLYWMARKMSRFDHMSAVEQKSTKGCCLSAVERKKKYRGLLLVLLLGGVDY